MSCPYHEHPFYSHYEWARSSRFESELTGPIEAGEKKLVRCPNRHGYHLVPADAVDGPGLTAPFFVGHGVIDSGGAP